MKIVFLFLFILFGLSRAEYLVTTKQKTSYEKEWFILYLDKETLSTNIKIPYVLACIKSAKSLSYPSDFNKELFLKDLEDLSKMLSLDHMVIEKCIISKKRKVCKKYKKEKLDSSVSAECVLNSLKDLRDALNNIEIDKAREIVLELDKYLGGR